MVDKAFHKLLTKIVGRDVMKRFRKKHKDDFLDLQREFEVKKRAIKPDLKLKVKLKIPVSLCEMYKRVNSESIMERIERDQDLNGKVNFMADKVMFDCSLFKDLFTFTCEHTVQHLANILRYKATRNVNTILMVGGFSESPMLFGTVKSSFRDKDVLLPDDAGLSVLRGAVIFGHKRKDISTRMSQFTIGFKMYNYYNPKIHPQETEIEQIDREMLVRDCFEKLVDIGQVLPLNEISRKKGVMPTGNNTYFDIHLYASQQPDPIFVHEPGCFKIGEVHVDCKDEKGNVKGATVQLIFGGTEFEVQAIHNVTGKKTKATFSFLD